ncbi:hypothetical protein LPJ61_003125 [Coemansia biformis]|uniref:Uncharacterized protein n=1 Tax=Coemansia biformis TaxID=1286918 RepID=A0A9W8CY04_9FUNG|nr:hypothetical protein LPJ61_003125 [Coemansia biformis]
MGGGAGPRMEEALGKSPQQSILNVLRIACAEALRQPDFGDRLQGIKQRFYVRDFDGIFLEPANLPVYTAQYVPRRALCYYDLFCRPELQAILRARPTVYCLGAGAGSELLGITAASCHALETGGGSGRPLTIHSQDYADWSAILQSLESAVRYKWSITEDLVSYAFSVGNLLEMEAEMEAHIGGAQLVTAMFVFNELFADKGNAIKFVKTLVAHMRPGSHFLLVDSAGSFSSVSVAGKEYMSYMFFDSLRQFFEPVISEDSSWFRHARALNYPLPVENMRYFVRLYRRK